MSDPNTTGEITAFDLESADEETLKCIELARKVHGESVQSRATEDGVAYGCESIFELLRDRAILYPDKTWLIGYADDLRQVDWSYGAFYTAACSLASAMRIALGIEPGDRVATLMVNDYRTVLVYFGAWLAGACVVPINCGEDDERVGYILGNSEAKACFCMSEQSVRLSGLRPEGLRHCVDAGSVAASGFHRLDDLIDAGHDSDSTARSGLHSEALIIYTSGTTGAPKGVVLDQGSILADAESIAQWHRFGPDDRALNVLPIHHVNGIIVTLMAPLCSGGSVVLNRKFSAGAFWKTIADEACTWASVVPTVLAFLCERAGDPKTESDLSRLRHIICGAGPLTCELARKFYDRFGVRVVHGYGLSETTCYSSFLPIDLDEADYRHWMFDCGFPSIGCPISANEMAIHDEYGVPMREDRRGEIVARGQNVMKYYFKRPDANKQTFAHNWFRSGDEGFRRHGADGRDYYFITGRIKELIIRGGINISPFDIDEVLSKIPGVKAAMAVGFENDFYGEEVGAYVQLEDGANTTSDEILVFARKHLPHSKSPKVVVFGDTFPVTSTGKYQRNKLKPMFAEWRSAEFRDKR
jgi:long-chain acyl-CoA synthetase